MIARISGTSAGHQSAKRSACRCAVHTTPLPLRRHAVHTPRLQGCGINLVSERWNLVRTASAKTEALSASPAEFASAFYKFTRPHTMIGTFVSVSSISLLALQGLPNVPVPPAWAGYMYALVSALLMNICIVGINQLFDVEIDKVNKPYLPLASGEFSMATGCAITIGTGIISLIIGGMSGSPALMATLVMSLALGIVYSIELPFMRWKRSPVLAAGCILAVRALAVQLGFFFHMQSSVAQHVPAALAATLKHPTTLLSIGSGMQVTPAILFTLCFMLLFSIVIALFKDLPDSKGDRAANVRTLTVRLGVPTVFWACIWILTAAYAGAVTYSVFAAHFWAATTSPLLAAPATAAANLGPSMLGSALPASLSLIGGSGGNLGLRVLACVAGHCLLAGLLWQRALKTDLNSNEDISRCYMHVWKLFYSEYILIPLLL